MPGGQQYAAAFLVEIAGQKLPDDVSGLLVSACVDDSRNLPDLFVLRFRDPDRLVVSKTGVTIGAAVKVSVAAPELGAPQPLLSGEVTALEVEIDGTGTYTVIRGLDHSHRLFRGRSTETYQQVTASDVVRKVAGRAGVAAGAIEATTVVHEHISQGNATDWQFLQGLAAEAGCQLSVVDGKLNFGKPTRSSSAPPPGGEPDSNPLVLQHGTDLLRLRATVTSAEQVSQVQVRGWDVAQKRALVGTAPAETTSAQLSTTPAELAGKFGGRTFVAVDVPHRSQAQVDTAAKAMADQLAGAFAELEGVSRGNPKLRAGTAIALDNLGPPWNGKYTVTSTRHLYEPATGYTTAFVVSGRQERSLYGLVSGGTPAGPAGGIRGVVPAVVTNAADPEDGARVKLKFPWLSDSYESDWARTVQLGAGGNRGAVLIPEVNDEVLVAFEQGDINRPYVVGGLYNGVDKQYKGPVATVDSGSGAVNRRAFVSRTGHRLEFLEATGGPDGIQLITGDGKLKLELDKQGSKITVHSDGTVLVEAKNGVTVDAGSSDIAMTGKAITLTAKQGVTVDAGSGTLGLTSKAKVDMHGTQVSVNGDAQTEIKGGATCAISAALVRIN
ncbi:MAG TPA: VgrG-related protein [Mycobacteriales bacterium]|nr:VgrG-related protein [Mycobacteriales bacterium]